MWFGKGWWGRCAGRTAEPLGPPLLILGLVLLVGGALALYLMTGRYVSEEDAYVQAVSASISAQISSQVIGIAIRSNAPVKKDDLLFKIDPEPYRITLANAEAQPGSARDQARTLIETYTLARGRSMRRELATLMQALDTTIADVALPYMQGSLSATKGTVQLMRNIGASIGHISDELSTGAQFDHYPGRTGRAHYPLPAADTRPCPAFRSRHRSGGGLRLPNLFPRTRKPSRSSTISS